MAAPRQPGAASRSAAAQPRPAPVRPAPAAGIPPLASLAALQAWLAESAPGAVLADGNPESGIIVIGEAPSAEDLRTRRPFTGPAGLLLDRMLAAIGLDRTACYITLLCPRRRVPGPPEPQDIERDLPLTRTHIRLVGARHILLLGGTPAQALTGSTTPISQLRGQPLDLLADGHRARALATFNPAYLLRRPADKARAWADLLAFRRLIAA
jgi:DNA polymerase